LAEIKSFPNNQDVYVGAEWVMKWLHGRTSGVFGAENNLATNVVPDSMSVEVSDGVGWLSNDKGDGIVFWNDSEQSSGSKLTLTHDVADGVLDRIDRIVVTWETTNYVALPEISILKGAASSSPVPPALTNNNIQRQISLARVNIPAGTVSLSPSMITDERLDPDVCGIVTETVKIDTTTMQSQFEALLKAIQDELQNLEAGTGVELKKLQFNNVSVEVADFVADATYEDFPFRASVPLEGVIGSMIPEVIFGLLDATSGNFAPVSESYNGGVYLYASDIPEADATIPVIICWKGNA
jgi:hypothetical protein